MNLFLKYKQEASGWPSDIDRDQYIQHALEKEGIVLDPKSVQTNPALRSLAKLCLNSCWGKFGQSENKMQASFFNNTQVSDFFKQMHGVLNKQILTYRISKLLVRI